MKSLHVKKVRLTCDEWPILEKEYQQACLETEDFSGKVAAITIKKVLEPQFWQHRNQSIIVCDAGMQWLIIVPDDQHYAITMMLDSQQKPVVWYVDFIENSGIDTDGTYYFRDLFLDLFIYPDGSMLEDDADELDAALAQGVITKDQWQRTRIACENLQASINQDFIGFKNWCNQIRIAFSKVATK